MHRRVTYVFMLLTLMAAPAAGQVEISTDRPDGHAPLGVLGDHMHEAGEFMVSYRYSQMRMDGLRVGEEEIFAQSILGDYGVAPTAMTTQMHALGVMYAPSNRITLMAMVPFKLKAMEHITAGGFFFRTESTGLADPSFAVLGELYQEGAYSAHVTGRVTAPIGSLDAQDLTPASAPDEVRLPYPMQIGTGTVAFSPDLTVLAMNEVGSVGAQVGATFRFSENSEGYRHGDRFRMTAWAARNISEYLSLSARLEWQRWGNLQGADPTFNRQVETQLVPTVFPDLQGGTRLDLPIGINLYIPEGELAGHRVAIELTLPLDQDLNGPQLANDWAVSVGWQKSIN